MIVRVASTEAYVQKIRRLSFGDALTCAGFPESKDPLLGKATPPRIGGTRQQPVDISRFHITGDADWKVLPVVVCDGIELIFAASFVQSTARNKVCATTVINLMSS
jgi:hypothetical protein